MFVTAGQPLPLRTRSYGDLVFGHSQRCYISEKSAAISAGWALDCHVNFSSEQQNHRFQAVLKGYYDKEAKFLLVQMDGDDVSG